MSAVTLALLEKAHAAVGELPPFASESAAIAWIVQRQDRLSYTAMDSAVRPALTVQAALA